MTLRIDRVESEIEIFHQGDGNTASNADTRGRSESGNRTVSNPGENADPKSGGGSDELFSTRHGRAELREKLRPIVMEILEDELTRIKRKVGSP